MGESRTALGLHRPKKAAREKEARSFYLGFVEGKDGGPVAEIAGQPYGWKFLGPLSGYDLTKPDGTIYQVRRVERDGVYLWVCSTQSGELCPAWEFSPRPKSCKHCKLGLHLGLIQ